MRMNPYRTSWLKIDKCSLTSDETPLERKKHMVSQEDDEETLQDFPMLCPPVHMDYGYNVKYVLNNGPCFCHQHQDHKLNHV